MTINQLLRERRKAFQVIKRGLRKLDTQVEVMQRKVELVLKRRMKVPEETDLAELLNAAAKTDVALDQVIKLLEDITRIFV